MNKRDARDNMAYLIMKAEEGRFKIKSTGERLTLQNLSELESFKAAKKLLAEKKISRTSVYKSIETKGYFSMDKDEYAARMKEIHDFCYTYLDK